MSKISTKNKLHKERFDKIKRFVDFKIDFRRKLTPYQKSKIKKYYDEIEKLTARPYQIYRPRNKKRLKEAQKYSGQQNSLPGIKVAFVPTPGANPVKIKFRGQTMRVVSQYSESTMIPLDLDKLIENPEKHVNERIKKSNATQFTIMAGVNEIPQAVAPSLLAGEIIALMNRYSDETENNYFGNWLYGVRGHKFKNQSDVDAYLRAKTRASAERAAQRKAERDQARYERMKEQHIIIAYCKTCDANTRQYVAKSKRSARCSVCGTLNKF